MASEYLQIEFQEQIKIRSKKKANSTRIELI